MAPCWIHYYQEVMLDVQQIELFPFIPPRPNLLATQPIGSIQPSLEVICTEVALGGGGVNTEVGVEPSCHHARHSLCASTLNSGGKNTEGWNSRAETAKSSLLASTWTAGCWSVGTARKLIRRDSGREVQSQTRVTHPLF